MKQYIVSVPGRVTPLCIEADSYSGTGGSGLTFFVGDQVVARLPEVDLVAQASCLGDFPALSQFAAPACAPLALEPGELQLPGSAPEANTFTTYHSSGCKPAWPFLSGLALGFIGGFGLVLSHLQVW